MLEFDVIYGRDDCLAVCPRNKLAERAADVRYHGRSEWMGVKLAGAVAWVKHY